jgi:hypothetical protein
MAVSRTTYWCSPLFSSARVGGLRAKEHATFDTAFTVNFLLLVHGTPKEAGYARAILGTAIPSRLAMREIIWEEKTFHLNVNRRKVKDSPLYDPSGTANGACDEEFLKYFGINWVEK